MTASWAGFLRARNFNAVSGKGASMLVLRKARGKKKKRPCGRKGNELTLQEPLQFGAVHVDVLHQLDVVNVHVVLWAHRQLL